MNEGFQANDRDDNDEDTDTKHGHDHDLLLDTHVQRCQVFHRERHYNNVQEDVDSGRDPALEMNVVAGTLVESIPLIPSHANGPALHQGDDEEYDGVDSTEGHDAVSKDSEALGRKDAKVEEEDGDFGDAEASHVEDLSQKVVEQNVGDLVSFECPNISSQTVFDHYNVVSKLPRACRNRLTEMGKDSGRYSNQDNNEHRQIVP